MMSANAASKSAKALSKTEILNQLAEKTGLSKKQVSSVLEELGAMITNNLGKKGPGLFNLPGIAKFKLKKKPATKARPGKNPFTGEAIMIKAKPASNAVRIQPLKALKDSV
jgi:nucleoid DNA-binding protein